MSQIVCIIGNKGGTGKTTLSHMLSHGLGLLGQRAVCAVTDHEREPLIPKGRRYVLADARQAPNRQKVLETLKRIEGWIGIIDGGANQTPIDLELYATADLVLLPFRDSPEDVRTVIADMRRFPNAWALPSQWPTNPWQYQAAQHVLSEFPTELQDRVLAPVFAVSASKTLLHKQIPETLATPLNNSARALAHQILELLPQPLPAKNLLANKVDARTSSHAADGVSTINTLSPEYSIQ